MKVARECMKDQVIKKHILNLIGNTIRSEIKAMVSDKVNSILRSKEISDLKIFNWNALIKELTIHTPYLFHIFNSITKTITPQDNQMAIIGMCIAILLKQRYSRMSLVQKVVSIIMYAGHASKQVRQIVYYPPLL